MVHSRMPRRGAHTFIWDLIGEKGKYLAWTTMVFITACVALTAFGGFAKGLAGMKAVRLLGARAAGRGCAVAAHFHPIIVSMSFSLLGSVSDILVPAANLGNEERFGVSPLLAHTIVEPK